MDIIMSICDRVTVLAGGQVLASGAPEAIRSDRAVIEAYLGPDEDPRERQKDDLLVLGPIE
jgi:branched-chain amino acid transport system ATP-binding protein